MAVAAYTTDLTSNVFNDFEGAAPTFGEFVGYTAGRGQALSTDYPIQGTTHADTVHNALGQASCAIDNGGNISWTSGWSFFSWLVWTAPGAIDTQANGGFVFIVGADITNFDGFYVGGSDFGSYPYGGWQNFAVNPEIGYSEVGGGGNSDNYRWLGLGVDVTPTKVDKGSPLGIDVIRYGRGEMRIVGGTSTDDDATFAGMAGINDDNANRWGLFQEIEGGYRWKSLMYFGYGAATEFTDVNVNILIENTEFVVPTFNKIEIHNASSVINWTNVSISALGTVSKGDLEMIDNAEFNDIGGVFTEMNSFIYDTNATLTGRTFRKCGLVTQGGATFDSVVFDQPASGTGMLVDDLDVVYDCVFNSDGTGYAMELDTTMSGNSYQLLGCTFTNYATVSGSTGNECIYNNTGGTVTIAVGAGQEPTAHDEIGSTTIVTSSVQLTMTVYDESATTISGAYAYIDDDDAEPYILNTITEADGIATIAHTGGAAAGSRWRVRKYGYKPYKQIIDIAGSNINIPVTLIVDPQQG